MGAYDKLDRSHTSPQKQQQQQQQDRVQIKNIYFEPVPLLLPAAAASDPNTSDAAPLVSTLVTEAGPVEGAAAISMVVARAQERRRRYEGLYYG